MNAEEEKIARKVWTESAIGTRRENLRELARAMIPPREFNRLQSEFQKEMFNPIGIISEILTLWKSFKPEEATLLTLKNIFRAHNLYNDAGK